MDRRIFSYWSDQGYGADGAPNTLVELCLRTISQNSACDLVLLGPENVDSWIEDFDPRWLHLNPAHQADLVRVRVLFTHGGLWVDADTIVQHSLRSLFDLLESEELDCIGCDWRPKRLNEDQPFAVSIMGPMRPGQQFLARALAGQRDALARATEWLDHPSESYPFRWAELLSDLVTPSFATDPPLRRRIFPGASGWLGLMGSPAWLGGDFANALDPVATEDELLARLRTFPLLGLSNSLYPREFVAQPEAAILGSRTIVGVLLSEALSHSRDRSP